MLSMGLPRRYHPTRRTFPLETHLSLIIILGIVLVLFLGAVAALIKRKKIDLWIGQYLYGDWRAPRTPTAGPKHVLFCFVDHYEPRWRGADYATEVRRVDEWMAGYPKLCEGHQDADGRKPSHSFFFPEEEYRPEHLDKLVDLCKRGYGEIEIHLHHDNDTEAGLRQKLRGFVDTLVTRHKALPVDPKTGRPMWSFIHGNWALDNSHPDGKHCGVNNEITILREEGCYADFTMPSAPDVTQTSTVNSIYYAKDDPHGPKSHDRGVRVRVGQAASGDLMMIQGPLGLLWKMRKYGVMPRIENGDVRESNPPVNARVDFWVDTGVHVAGRPEWVFVKVHTHGTQERDIKALLGQPTGDMFSHLESRYNDGKNYVLHYVSAREMYNIAKAAEAGCSGNPNEYRDHVVPKPGYLDGQ